MINNMKRLLRFGLIIILISAIVSCEYPYNIFNGEFRYVEYTGNIEALTGEAVDIDDVGILFTWIADSLLLTKNPYDEKGFISVYSLESHQRLLDYLVLNGRGPNEYYAVEMVRLFTDSTGVKAWLEVNYREKLICVDVTASIIIQKLVVEQEVEITLEDQYAVFRAFFDSDTSVVLQSFFNNDQISMYNPVTGQVRYVGWLYSEDYNRQDVADLSTNYVYNAKKSVIVGGMCSFNQINFYPLKNGAPFSISTARKAIRYNDFKSIIPDKKRPRYYGSVYFDEDRLILGYDDKKNDYELYSVENNFLHVVSWEGELLHIFQLDRHIDGHSYDKRTGYLYGVDWEDTQIYRFKIDL